MAAGPSDKPPDRRQPIGTGKERARVFVQTNYGRQLWPIRLRDVGGVPANDVEQVLTALDGGKEVQEPRAGLPP